MPGTPRALAQTALRGFNAAFGPTCHDAVLEWLEAAEYVPNDAHTRLFAGVVGSRPNVYAEVLVKSSDPRIMTLAGFNQLPMGTIIGFYKDGGLMHSLLVADHTILVGANNAGVWDPAAAKFPKVNDNLHAIFLTNQLLWNAEDSTCGRSRYKAHFQAPPEIARRINQRLA